jgi:hypothetical protein
VNAKDSLLELQRLRKRLAGSEKLDTLRHLIEDTTALKGIAPDRVLETIGDFTDRIHDKIERLKNKAPAS